MPFELSAGAYAAIGAIAGAGIGAWGSQGAANAQADATRRGQDFNMQMFQQTRGDLAPWMRSGGLANTELNSRLGLEGDSTNANFGSLLHPFGMQDFQASPAYQFDLEQGKQAIDKASAARGNFYAPTTLQDIAKYSQGLASHEFQNAFSNYNTNQSNIYGRLSDVSGSGQNAAAGLGGLGQKYGAQISDLMTQGGNARAGGIGGTAAALQGGINNYALLMNSQRPSVQPPANPYGGGVTYDPAYNNQFEYT